MGSHPWLHVFHPYGVRRRPPVLCRDRMAPISSCAPVNSSSCAMPRPDGRLFPPVLLSILPPVLCRTLTASCFLLCSCQFFFPCYAATGWPPVSSGAPVNSSSCMSLKSNSNRIFMRKRVYMMQTRYNTCCCRLGNNFFSRLFARYEINFYFCPREAIVAGRNRILTLLKLNWDSGRWPDFVVL